MEIAATSLRSPGTRLLGGLYMVVPRRPDSLPTLVALYLALVTAPTLPHTLIVTWMDLRQGVWRR